VASRLTAVNLCVEPFDSRTARLPLDGDVRASPPPCRQMTVAQDSELSTVDLIVERLSVDALRCIVSRAMLEASNTRVVRALAGIETTASEGHATIQNSLRVMLCLEIARLFDLGARPIEQQSKASFPVLAYYLNKNDVRRKLAERTTDAPERIAQFLGRWALFETSVRDRDALKRVRELRDWEIAHSIYDREANRPTYLQVFRLVGVAAVLSCYAQNAVGHPQTDYKDNVRGYNFAAREFWARFVEGTRTEAVGKLFRKAKDGE
jgi:hypothetical protein